MGKRYNLTTTEKQKVTTLLNEENGYFGDVKGALKRLSNDKEGC